MLRWIIEASRVAFNSKTYGKTRWTLQTVQCTGSSNSIVECMQVRTLNTYLYEYRCASSYRTSGGTACRRTGTDRDGCPNVSRGASRASMIAWSTCRTACKRNCGQRHGRLDADSDWPCAQTSFGTLCTRTVGDHRCVLFLRAPVNRVNYLEIFISP